MDLTKKFKGINPKEILSVGLDVASKKIDVCFWKEDEKLFFQIKNNSKDIGEFAKQLIKLNLFKKIPFVIESTGDLHILAALLLTEHGFTVKEINPIITKHYVSHNVRGTKTDKTDAEALAKIGVIEGKQLMTFERPKEFIELKKKISLISSLENQLQSIKASIKNHKKTGKKLGFIASDVITELEILVKKFEKQIKKLQAEIENHEFKDPEVKKVIERIDSITGITKYTATVCFVSFAHKKFVSKEAMFAFTGCEPKLKQSGEKNNGIRISKRGNSYVRKKLFQSAFCSTRHCELFSDIYIGMKEKGKHHYIAILCVVKKMIHIMRSMMKNKTYFESNYNII